MTVSFGKMFNIGCGDSSCTWGNKGGMVTNGGCRCDGIGRGTSQLDVKGMEKRMKLRSGIFLLRQLAALPEVEAALHELVRKTRQAAKRENISDTEETDQTVA